MQNFLPNLELLIRDNGFPATSYLPFLYAKTFWNHPTSIERVVEDSVNNIISEFSFSSVAIIPCPWTPIRSRVSPIR